MTKPWLERPRTIRLLWFVYIVVLALTVLAELAIDRHGYFGIDGTFGFNAWYGLVTCVAMIVVAKVCGVLLKRRDTYYETDVSEDEMER